jgi:hypothetical protein
MPSWPTEQKEHANNHRLIHYVPLCLRVTRCVAHARKATPRTEPHAHGPRTATPSKGRLPQGQTQSTKAARVCESVRIAELGRGTRSHSTPFMGRPCSMPIATRHELSRSGGGGGARAGGGGGGGGGVARRAPPPPPRPPAPPPPPPPRPPAPGPPPPPPPPRT